MTFYEIAHDVDCDELATIVSNISNDNYRCVKTSLEKGYQKKNLASVRAYNGRYGVGFVIVHNYNTHYRGLLYCIVEKVNKELKKHIDYINKNLDIPNYRKF